MSTTIRVLVYEPTRQRGTLREFDRNDLDTMQQLVGGWIQIVGFRNGLLLVCNDDGVRLQLPANRGIAGTFFIARQDGDELASLSATDIVYVQHALGDFAS